MEDNWYHLAYGRAMAVPAYQVLVYGSACLLLVPYLSLCRPTIVYLLLLVSMKAYARPYPHGLWYPASSSRQANNTLWSLRIVPGTMYTGIWTTMLLCQTTLLCNPTLSTLPVAHHVCNYEACCSRPMAHGH